MTGREIGRVTSGARLREDLMVKPARKASLLHLGEIPCENLVVRQSYVSYIESGNSIQELVEDNTRRG